MENKAKIAPALLAAQKEMPNVAKDSKNPFFKNSYASLTAVLNAVRPILNAHGITIIQSPIEGKDGLGCLALETILLHESGESISSISVVPLAKGDPQAYGSALTYARRYSLASMTGLATDDDDANHATPKIDPRVKAQMDATGYPSDSGVQSTVQTTKPPTAVNQTPKNGSWRDVAIHFGKNKGTTLGELKNSSIQWYFKEWEPKPWKGVISEADKNLQAALKEWHDEVHKSHGDEIQEPAGREDYQDDEPTLQEEMAKDDFQW